MFRVSMLCLVGIMINLLNYNSYPKEDPSSSLLKDPVNEFVLKICSSREDS